MRALEITGLEKSFKDNKVIDGLDLTADENMIYGFIGKKRRCFMILKKSMALVFASLMTFDRTPKTEPSIKV